MNTANASIELSLSDVEFVVDGLYTVDEIESLDAANDNGVALLGFPSDADSFTAIFGY